MLLLPALSIETVVLTVVQLIPVVLSHDITLGWTWPVSYSSTKEVFKILFVIIVI